MKVSPSEPDPEVGMILAEIAPTLQEMLEDKSFAIFVFDAQDEGAQMTFIATGDEETVKKALRAWAKVDEQEPTLAEED